MEIVYLPILFFNAVKQLFLDIFMTLVSRNSKLEVKAKEVERHVLNNN